MSGRMILGSALVAGSLVLGPAAFAQNALEQCLSDFETNEYDYTDKERNYEVLDRCQPANLEPFDPTLEQRLKLGTGFQKVVDSRPDGEQVAGKRSYEWLLPVAMSGHPDGLYRLSVVEKDDARSNRLLILAAKAGSDDAKWRLINMYKYGTGGMSKDPAMVEALYRDLAARGHQGAQIEVYRIDKERKRVSDAQAMAAMGQILGALVTAIANAPAEEWGKGAAPANGTYCDNMKGFFADTGYDLDVGSAMAMGGCSPF